MPTIGSVAGQDKHDELPLDVKAYHIGDRRLCTVLRKSWVLPAVGVATRERSREARTQVHLAACHQIQ